MNELRKAAQLALEALEDVFGLEKKDVGAINALRQALAQSDEEELLKQGWRQCAVGQRTTQYCGMAELARLEEREAIMNEWYACVQSDLEHGVKSLNERAAEKWRKEYPAIAGFADTIEARGEK